jgi:hypothetical protein
MNSEDYKARWREEAHSRATGEAKAAGLQGTEREQFVAKRRAEIYAELEKIGRENLKDLK